MYYATDNYSDGRIDKNATIKSFATEQEAHEWLLSCYNPTTWNHGTAIIEGGDFGDCWIKTNGSIENVDIAPFEVDDLIIRESGQHPGNHGTWITPYKEVLIVSHIEEVD